MCVWAVFDWMLLMVVSVVIAVGKRPVSFRTRKLSLPAPMVLHSGGCGRVGRRRTQRDSRGPPRRGGPRLLLYVRLLVAWNVEAIALSEGARRIVRNHP